MSLSALLSHWRSEAGVASNVVSWETTPARAAQSRPFPEDLHPRLATALGRLGIRSLYTHQSSAWQLLRAGQNVVIVTGTASGKTLCYNLPVVDRLLRDDRARALFLFPTKALAQDQKAGLERLCGAIPLPEGSADHEGPIPLAIYDGDTPAGARPAVRANARIILSNPDMLHAGILPHHTTWEGFFRHLQFVVIDEIHTYRGVFGSHVTNVLRRLQRVAQFYGASPQFILTSATIANPVELAEGLVEAPVALVDDDGAPHGPKHFLIYNPPIVNRELGLRRSALIESVRLAQDLIERNIQTILFARSRRSVELLLSYLRQTHAGPANDIRGYRSGYLPRERREIERGLREGAVKGVAATNALELGIDIGSLDAAILVGYPGTIAASQQQAGRAGRKEETSLAVMVASADALDQFLAHHPEYFLERSPEQALINPDNLLILLHHLRCAAFELPFHPGEGFGRLPPETVEQFLQLLEESGVLHASNGSYYWMSEKYPAGEISLRSAAGQAILLQAETEEGPQTIGEVDYSSATWMVHPQAVYLHEGQSYLVESLDLEQHLASLRPAATDYYTEPRTETSVQPIQILSQAEVRGGVKTFGEILVTSQVIGYRRVQWYTHEQLGIGELTLPPTELRTTGYWLSIGADIVESLREMGLWSNDPNDYGPNWPRQRDLARARDGYRCQVCYALEGGRAHHVHHKVPFRTFSSYEEANRLENLITVCPSCHRKVETAVRMRSGLSGLAYALGHLAPFYLMCDTGDLGVHSDPQSPLSDGQPTVVLFDTVPDGIGLSQRLFEIHAEVLSRARELVSECECAEGCPSCTGPAGENGAGAKRETQALLEALSDGFSL